MKDEEIKSLFESYGQYVNGKDYALIRAIEKVISPQRTWVSMTNEQFLEACKIAEGGNYMVAFQRIQQWLKENNA
jgi:hypothetical protein